MTLLRMFAIAFPAVGVGFIAGGLAIRSTNTFINEEPIKHKAYQAGYDHGFDVGFEQGLEFVDDGDE